MTNNIYQPRKYFCCCCWICSFFVLSSDLGSSLRTQLFGRSAEEKEMAFRTCTAGAEERERKKTLVGNLSNLTAHQDFCHGIVFVVVTERRKKDGQGNEHWIKDSLSSQDACSSIEMSLRSLSGGHFRGSVVFQGNVWIGRKISMEAECKVSTRNHWELSLWYPTNSLHLILTGHLNITPLAFRP